MIKRNSDYIQFRSSEKDRRMASKKVFTQPLLGWMMHYLWWVDEISVTTGRIIDHGIDANKLLEYCHDEIESGRKDLVDLADKHYKHASNVSFELTGNHTPAIVTALVTNAALAIRFDKEGEAQKAMTYGMKASELFGMFWATTNLLKSKLELYGRLSKLDTISKARKSAQAKHSKSPKRSALNSVRGDWETWQKDKSTYKSKAAFAREMVDAYPALQSTKAIEDKCRIWEKQAVSK